MTIEEFREGLFEGRYVMPIPPADDDWPRILSLFEDIQGKTILNERLSFGIYMQRRIGKYNYACYNLRYKAFNAMNKFLPSELINLKIIKWTEIDAPHAVEIADTEFYNILCG